VTISASPAHSQQDEACCPRYSTTTDSSSPSPGPRTSKQIHSLCGCLLKVGGGNKILPKAGDSRIADGHAKLGEKAGKGFVMGEGNENVRGLNASITSLNMACTGAHFFVAV
jgi:hypothetical protein